MLHIEDRQEKDLKKAASLADTYSVVHKSNTGKKANCFLKPGPRKNSDDLDDSAKSKNDGSTPLKCLYCKKEGHKIQNCKDPSFEQFLSSFTQPSVKTNTAEPKPVSNVMVPKSVDLFKEFKFDGAIVHSENDRNSVTVLRDTGAAISLLSSKALPNIKTCLTGEKLLMKDLTRTTSIPLAEIYLDCPLVKDKVVLGILDSDMPVDGVNLLLGNDLAGNLTVPNLVISSTPVEVEPDVNPVAVVTRSQTLKDDVTVQSQDDILNNVMTQGKLVQAQLNDESLTGLHHQPMEGN